MRILLILTFLLTSSLYAGEISKDLFLTVGKARKPANVVCVDNQCFLLDEDQTYEKVLERCEKSGKSLIVAKYNTDAWRKFASQNDWEFVIVDENDSRFKEVTFIIIKDDESYIADPEDIFLFKPKFQNRNITEFRNPFIRYRGSDCATCR